ncbi:MAG: hydrogenase iron-sulfur subunit [Anaerolineales bacterium]|jgi:F420-non-reducing hydrogenase iron-sulfur subunit
MSMETKNHNTKILILATLSGGYAGADSVGQLHVDYAPNTYILPVMCPSMFPEDFYLRAFERGMDAIIVMYSGTDSPYKGGPERTAKLINGTYERMKTLGIDTRRLRLTAICTVCTKPFLKEVQQMNSLLEEIGPVRSDFSKKSEESIVS